MWTHCDLYYTDTSGKNNLFIRPQEQCLQLKLLFVHSVVLFDFYFLLENRKEGEEARFQKKSIIHMGEKFMLGTLVTDKGW